MLDVKVRYTKNLSTTKDIAEQAHCSHVSFIHVIEIIAVQIKGNDLHSLSWVIQDFLSTGSAA